MSVSEFELFQAHQRSNWVRLRTLVMLRWFAIMGQSVAIIIAIRVYDLEIQFSYAAATIGASVVANLVSSLLYPENKRLSEREASLMLVFDIVQLSALLFLTGGLNNPFALLILAPVTIASTVLHLNSTIALGLLTIGLVSVLSQFSLPIETKDGVVLALPVLFQFGFWAALIIGVVFLAIYARQVTNEMHAMREALVATQLALAREQKLTDLGGVIAAAAHELGTPLATIKLVSAELMEELENHPHLLEDADLLRQQADRCRDILHSMGRAGKDDLYLRHAPLETVVREAAEPHMERGKTVNFHVSPQNGTDQNQPTILRQPEIVHGLRNLIQNAVDYCNEDVDIDISWSADSVGVRITDDGGGFPLSVIGRIGDPYVRRRRQSEDRDRRPGYEGMGLGLFIAKTLLERSGAKLSFSNGRKPGHASWSGQPTGGAVVEVKWARSSIEQADHQRRGGLGENILNIP